MSTTSREATVSCWSLRRISLCVVAVDALALAVAVLVAGDTLAALSFGVIAVLALAWQTLRSQRLFHAALLDAPVVWRAMGAATLLTSPVALALGEAPSLMVTALCACLFTVGGRIVTYGGLRALRRRGHLLLPTVVVGAGTVGQQLAERLRARPEYGLEVLGLVDDVGASGIDEDAGPLLATLATADAYFDRTPVRAVVVAYGPHSGRAMIPVLRSALRRGIPVFTVPRFFEVGPGSDGVVREYAAGVPVVPLGRQARLRTGWRAKRLLDVVVAAVGLVVLAPLIGLIALLVKLSSPGPALFRQRRVGLHGQPIEVLKFRSMRENDRADEQWSVAGDEGVTRVGKILRRTSLDELPQLWNVLVGDMSLVGPRPERPHWVSEFSSSVPGYDLRHRVPAGLTGLAQVEGERGYGSSIPERVALDNRYIEEWTLWMDVAILANTLKVVLHGDKPPPQPAAAPNEGEAVPAATSPLAPLTETGAVRP